ncbi:Na+/H+ antiporter subunit G [Halovenus sp. WSH3]|uniref:Na+/H+ antiporter subunit G n=1 Tax=Halovenus carboxidivorans TaxID=2692199 RepID=A0A6B0TCW9_9EURY|nr:Na+/H+ antiporter subunit G [Halovenus carboxidivorans]
MIESVRTGGAILFVALGLFFTFVSAVGVLRLPDIYSRSHTASQADTLGAGFTLAGVALVLGVTPVTIKTVLLLFFIFVTNPTAAHAVARAAHEEGIEPWTTDDDRTDRDLFAAAKGTAAVETADPGEPGPAGAEAEDVTPEETEPGDGGEPA